MYRRNCEPELTAALADTPVVLLNGARQTGKSTLVTTLTTAAASGVAATLVTLDDATALAAATNDPQGFIAGLGPSAVIDEVQKAPGLFPAIKLSVDRDRRPGRFPRKTGDRPRFLAIVPAPVPARRPNDMPRHARIVAAGFPMHAILRGIDRTAIFFADADRLAFLDALAGLAASESVRVHAYVLMTNHVHLLMTPESERGPSLLMKGLGQRYVQHVNRAYRRSGTLFEGRFRSSVIEADSYLLACQRYIELNPVRAHMVHAPGDYPWSSYRCNALGGADPVVAAHPLYLALAETEEARRSTYRDLFADEIPEDALVALRDATNGGFALGSPRFLRQIAAMIGRRTWPGKSGRPKKEPPDASQLDLPL
jgi:putative transposase